MPARPALEEEEEEAKGILGPFRDNSSPKLQAIISDYTERERERERGDSYHTFSINAPPPGTSLLLILTSFLMCNDETILLRYSSMQSL